MEADGPDVKRPRLDPHYPHSAPPHPPPPPPPPPPPAAAQRLPQYPEPQHPHYPPHTLPPPPLQTQPQSLPGTPLGPRAPRALPEPVGYQHPQHRPVNAAPVSVPPSRSYSIESLSRPPSNPNQPSPIDTRPRPIAVTGPPDSVHPPMEHGHHPGAYQNPEPHMNGAAQPAYPPPPTPHHQYNGPPLGPTQGYHPSPYPQPNMYAPGTDYVGASRKRQVRAVQACNNCRNRKQKCDEARPCQFCRESGLKCEYKEVPPPKQDRTLHDISTKLAMLVDQFSPIPSRLDRIERQLRGQQSGDGTLQTPSDQFPAPTPVVAEEAEGSAYDPVRENTSSEPPPHTAARTLAGPKFSAPPPNAPSPESSKQSQVPDIFEGEITLPADHTTSAHQLLSEWESMEPFFRDVCPTGANYAREEEENRGLLRLYGRGEGEDMYDGGHGGSPAADTTEDDTTPAPSPRDSNGWGFGFTPTAGVEVHRSSPQDWGGLNPDGTLKLDLRTIRRLHQSYLQHIHPLQPFLDKGRLSVMVENFIARYSPDPPAPTGNVVVGPRSPFAVPGDQYGDRYGHNGVPLKRKRSNNGMGPGQDGGTPPRRMQVERSIGNAIVLLVFALGRICEHKTHLSGPIGGPTTAIGSGLQPSVDSPPTAIKPSPASSHSTLASIPSPGFEGPRFTSRRSSAEHLPSFEKRDFTARNIDVTPGLAYYAYAVEILGAVHGGNDLSHGQAGVLAALYMGQLARVMESWGWICYACRVCGVLIDKDKDALRPDAPDEPSNSMDLRKVMPGVTTDRRKRNLMKFLFWTCLQLESDILAEMSHLRPSGISKDEERIGLPSQIYPDMPLDPPEEMNWLYYSAQIQLRKILNRTHLALYSKQARKKSFWASLKDDQLEEQLQGWRDTLPQWLQWDDADDPALDINTARMRAKYYGAKYIITRPVLHWAVQQKDPPRWLVKMYVPSSDSSSSPDESPRFPMDVNAEARWHKVISTSKRCVDAAIQSTLAFDGVESPSQRLIVTNIYGTAHAQFGNMLVLAAVRRSWLRDLIPLARLNELMERTIKFLRRLIPISPTMRVDVAILENTQKCVNGEKSDSASVEASFGA